jgi:hypothetical protein
VTDLLKPRSKSPSWPERSDQIRSGGKLAGRSNVQTTQRPTMLLEKAWVRTLLARPTGKATRAGQQSTRVNFLNRSLGSIF